MQEQNASCSGTRPKIITCICVLYFATGALSIPPADIGDIFFGFSVVGKKAIVLGFIRMFLYIVLGVGLLKLWGWSRKVAIGLEFYNLININLLYPLITYQTKGFHAEIDRAMMSAGFDAGDPAARMILIVFLIIGGVIMILLNVLILWFLFKHKGAFEKR